jgi:hypothetical protein
VTGLRRYDRAIVSSQLPHQVAPTALVPGVFGSTGPFGRFADDLLSIEFPDLPVDRRDETVGFVCRRAAQVPTPLLIGIGGLSVGLGVLQRTIGRDRTTRFLLRTTLPVVGELPRLVRSLAVAYIWETWPASAPTGAAT